LGVQSLSIDELLAILAAAKAKRERDWLMMLVGFAHGLRPSEVVALTPDNIHDGMITVQRLKGSMRTTQPLLEHENPLLNECEPLTHWALLCGPKQRLFKVGRQHFWRLFRAYADASDIPAHKAHPHVLKHSIAMQIIGTAGIEKTRQYLGHKSISSTGEYLKTTDAEASAAVGKALKL